MKTQDQLNHEYDNLMLDFQQKAFIESAFRTPGQSNNSKPLSKLFEDYSKFFNSEYNHIYLKPLNDLPSRYTLDDLDTDVKNSFSSVAKQLPLIFWTTRLGVDIVVNQSKGFIKKLLALPATEERDAFYISSKIDIDMNDSALVSIRELSQTDKIKIQEKFTDFMESFINSPILPDSIKESCFRNLMHEIDYLINPEGNRLSIFSVDLRKESEFLIEMLYSFKPNKDLHNIYSHFLEHLSRKLNTQASTSKSTLKV